MKRKLLLAGLLAAVVALMSSCVIIFPDDYEKTWISEISLDNGAGHYEVLWDDGATYNYRAGNRHGTYDGLVTVRYNGCNYDVYAPTGNKTLRVTLMFENKYGDLEYVDKLAYCSNIDDRYRTTIYVTENDVNVVNPSYRVY